MAIIRLAVVVGMKREGGIYRVFYPRTWSDPEFRSLSAPAPSARDLLLYLILGEATCIVPGILRASRAGLADELRWPPEDFDRCFAELVEKGFAHADWDLRVVVLQREVPNARPQSPNVVTSWVRALKEFPSCEVLNHGLRLLAETLQTESAEAFVKVFREAFPEAFRKDFAKALLDPFSNSAKEPVNQYQYQYQEQEQEQEQNPPASPERDEPFDLFLSRYPEHRRKAGAKVKAAYASAVTAAGGSHVLMAALENQMASEQWSTPKYVPSTLNWLTGELWRQRLPRASAAPSHWRTECLTSGHHPSCERHDLHVLRMQIKDAGCTHRGVCISFAEHGQQLEYDRTRERYPAKAAPIETGGLSSPPAP